MIIAPNKTTVNTLAFQINRAACSKGISKKELEINFASNRNSWELQEGLEAFIDACEKGYTIQFGVNEVSSKKTDIQFFDGFVFDYDGSENKQSLNIEQILNIPFISKHCFAYQYSISHSSNEKPKVHLFFAYSDRRTQIAEVEAFQKAVKKLIDTSITDIYGNGYASFDPAMFKNAGQVIFCRADSEVFVMDDFQYVDFEEYRKIFINKDYYTPDIAPVQTNGKKNKEPIKPIFNLKTTLENEASTNTDNVRIKTLKYEKTKKENIDGAVKEFLTYLNTEVVLSRFDGQWWKLYDLHQHNFINAAKENAIEQMQGSNPFSETDRSKKSFKVALFDEQMTAVWFDRSNSVSVDRLYKNDASGGTYIEYWYCYHNLIASKAKYKGKTIEDSFKSICNDICKYWNIERYEFKSESKKNQEALIDYIRENHEVIKDYIKPIHQSNNYLYYDFYFKHWTVSATKKDVVNFCMKYLFNITNMGYEIGIINEHLNMLLDNFDRFERVKDLSRFQLKFQQNSHIVPLKDGDYNTRTQTFTEDYDPFIFNFDRYERYEYKKVDEENENVKRLLDYLYAQYPRSVADMLLNWFTLNVTGRAYKTGKMVAIFGTPGTGKSAILRLLISLLGNLNEHVNGNNMFNKENKFVNGNLLGKYALTIDECEPSTYGWTVLKNLTGSTNPMPIPVEKKGLMPYMAFFSGAVTTATQDKMHIPNSDDGGIRRRLVLVQHTSNMYNPKYENIEDLLCTDESIHDIFMYLITRDVDKALADFKDYARGENKTVLSNVIKQNDLVLMFMKECLSFTDNDGIPLPESISVTNAELQAAFKWWLHDSMSETWEAHKLQKISRYVREKAQIKDNNINWKYADTKTDSGDYPKVLSKESNTYVRGLIGVKLLKSITTDTDSNL